MTATKDFQNSHILRYQKKKDGVKAWIALNNAYKDGGSSILKTEDLLELLRTEYNAKSWASVAVYIDRFQTWMAQVIALQPLEFHHDSLRKKQLCNNLKNRYQLAIPH